MGFAVKKEIIKLSYTSTYNYRHSYIVQKIRLYTKSGAWKNSSPGFQFLYTKRQISNIIKVYKNN